MHITFTSPFVPAIDSILRHGGVKYRVVNVEAVKAHPRSHMMGDALAKRITCRVVFAD